MNPIYDLVIIALTTTNQFSFYNHFVNVLPTRKIGILYSFLKQITIMYGIDRSFTLKLFLMPIKLSVISHAFTNTYSLLEYINIAKGLLYLLMMTPQAIDKLVATKLNCK